MSGIYIPGMEMPRSCCECFAFKSNANGYLFCKAKRISFGKEDAEWLPLKTPNWCPLIPVPDHGRLIDADKLGTPSIIEEDTLWRGRIETEVFLAETINHAPPIIPAEEEQP